MPVTDPQSTHNPATGTVAPAAWGDAVRDGIIYLNGTGRPRCRVRNSASISVTTSGTFQILTFDTELYDEGGCHSTVSNTSRLTVPSGEGGVYLIGATVSFAANATGPRGARIKLNGATYLASTLTDNASAAATADVTVVTEYALAAGDYVEVDVVQSSGGALNALASNPYSPSFWFEWVAT